MTTWIEKAGGLGWEESNLLKRAGLCHGVTGRGGGVSAPPFGSLNLSFSVGDDARAVLENRRRLCAAVGADLTGMTLPEQVDGGHIVVVGDVERGCGAGSSGSALAHADALITRCRGVLLAVLVADDVPVVLYDPVAAAVAVVHAGLPGTQVKLAVRTVQAMELVYGSKGEDILAYIGPSVSQEHCQVSEGAAVAVEKMGPAYARCVGRGGARTLDLRGLNARLLQQAGVARDHIEVSPSCTFADAGRFFSYRRDYGRTGRMAAFAMLV